MRFSFGRAVRRLVAVVAAALLALDLDDLLANLGDDDVPDVPALRTQGFDVSSDGSAHAPRVIADRELRAKPGDMSQAAADALVAEGNELFRDERFAEAVTRFERAVRVFPQHALGWKGLGHALLCLGQAARGRARVRSSDRPAPR